MKKEDLDKALSDDICENIEQSTVDESIQESAEFLSEAGLEEYIVRTAEANCCEWCSSLEGTYRYPDEVPPEIYQRHSVCNCLIEFISKKTNTKQNVHSKVKTILSKADIEKLKNDKPVIENKAKNVTMKKEHRLRMNLQLFAEKALYEQTSAQLRKGIRSLKESIDLHKRYINDPTIKCEDYYSRKAEYQKGLIKHWEKEIRNANRCIQNRIDELKKRGESFD